MTKPPLSPLSSVFCWQPVKLMAPAAITNTVKAKAALITLQVLTRRIVFSSFPCMPTRRNPSAPRQSFASPKLSRPASLAGAGSSATSGSKIHNRQQRHKTTLSAQAQRHVPRNPDAQRRCMMFHRPRPRQAASLSTGRKQSSLHMVPIRTVELFSERVLAQRFWRRGIGRLARANYQRYP
jgi:hypothetical protein